MFDLGFSRLFSRFGDLCIICSDYCVYINNMDSIIEIDDERDVVDFGN
jgi:hypothetical protein